MQFIIIHDKKLIFFWSPKCGCTTLKSILVIYFNIENTIKYKHVHCNEELGIKINKRNKNKIDIYKNYDIVMLIRNPYKRLVSGFLNKYVSTEVLPPVFQHIPLKTTSNCNCFYDFCHVLSKNPKKIDKHHFEKQTTGEGWQFYNELQRPDIKYILDTSKVNDIIKILGLNIDERKENYNPAATTTQENDKKELWSQDYNTLRNLSNINHSNFYNDDIKKLVYNIYKDDFIFLNNTLNMNYTI